MEIFLLLQKSLKLGCYMECLPLYCYNLEMDNPWLKLCNNGGVTNVISELKDKKILMSMLRRLLKGESTNPPSICNLVVVRVGNDNCLVYLVLMLWRCLTNQGINTAVEFPMLVLTESKQPDEVIVILPALTDKRQVR
uniref:Uncharacterized protein n=1 Tax=Lactuca sativa TaxID=4236 RepID=A0A9R1VAT7_LACSA|nr:hypothetical protein LSAT_V11C600331540 [Lactuca sativa]